MTKVRTLALAAFAAVAALAHALAPAAPAAARQTDARGIGLVNIRVEGGREVRLYDKSYALVVGVSDYTAGWPKLPGVRSDVEAVSAALERQGFLVTVVLNPDHTQLDKSFKEFISAHGRNVENRLLFYFAGHGHTVKQSYGEEMGYIVPADAPNPNRDPNGFLDRATSMRQIELYAESIQSKHALFLFDSCFSGQLFALTRAVPESISYKTARHVRQFITSGSADEQVPDRSIFRRQFVEALDGDGDVNRDGYVTGTELGEFLQDKVVNYSRNAQHPQYGKIRNPNLDKGDFVFALPAKANAAAASGPAPPPARVDPAAVELAFWDAIKNSTDPEDFREYLKKYPDGQFAGIARRRAAPPAAPANATENEDVFAYLDGRAITLADLSTEEREKIQQLRGRLAEAARANNYAYDLRTELYQVQKTAVDLAINDMLLNREAKRRNMTTLAVLQQEVKDKARPVSDRDVREFYDKNKSRINGEFDAVRAQIRSYLQEEEERRLAQEFANRLRAGASVRVLLVDPQTPAKK